MSKPLVYVTSEIPEKGLELLEKECELGVNRKGRVLTKEEIIKNIKGAEGIITLLGDTIDREVIESNPELKAIANYAVGYNNIDVDAATELGIAVSNTPGILTETTADLTWALIMATARRIVESDRFTRKGKFKGWMPKLMLGTDVYGKTLGIVGFGRIGQAVGRRAKGFQMEVIYNKRNPLSAEEEKELGATYYELDDLLKEADFVSINAPLNDSTHHLIGEREFGLMKNSAILINSGRGPIVDESALVDALKEGQIAAAGLDVYEDEPEVHPELIDMDNVVLLPHIGTASVETREAMAVMVAEDVLAGLKGEKIPHIVNPDVGK